MDKKLNETQYGVPAQHRNLEALKDERQRTIDEFNKRLAQIDSQIADAEKGISRVTYPDATIPDYFGDEEPFDGEELPTPKDYGIEDIPNTSLAASHLKYGINGDKDLRKVDGIGSNERSRARNNNDDLKRKRQEKMQRKYLPTEIPPEDEDQI